MRFPLSLTSTMIGYIGKKKITGKKKFPLVLMLEPLHACNLTCTGCGRIREYSQTIKDKLSVEECMVSVDEAAAPIVSICGGEPLIYPEIGRLVKEILDRRKHILAFFIIFSLFGPFLRCFSMTCVALCLKFCTRLKCTHLTHPRNHLNSFPNTHLRHGPH